MSEAYTLGDPVQIVREGGLNSGRIGVCADVGMRKRGYAFDLRVADRLGPDVDWSSWVNAEDLVRVDDQKSDCPEEGR